MSVESGVLPRPNQIGYDHTVYAKRLTVWRLLDWETAKEQRRGTSPGG